jgi:hypothetical protein
MYNLFYYLIILNFVSRIIFLHKLNHSKYYTNNNNNIHYYDDSNNDMNLYDDSNNDMNNIITIVKNIFTKI